MTSDSVSKIKRLKADWPDNIALQCFDPDYFATLSEDHRARLLKCLNSGIENPDSQMGCYACQPSDYDDFKSFFSKVLSRYHNVPEDARHVNDWCLKGVEDLLGDLPDDRMLDVSRLGLSALSMRIRTARNLKDFPLPGSMTKEDRIRLEEKMMAAFDILIEMPHFGGRYYSLTPGNPCFIDEETYVELVDAHIMFKNMDADRYLTAAGIAADWPFGRGCYVSADRGAIIWVGEEDHLRIMCMQYGTVLNEVFDRLKSTLDVVEGIDGLEFAYSVNYGVVTSCPTNLGTGMRASLHVALPNLTADGTDIRVKAIAKPLGLSVRGIGGEHTPIGADGTVDISPRARFCVTEAEIVTGLYKSITLLMARESKGDVATEFTSNQDH